MNSYSLNLSLTNLRILSSFLVIIAISLLWYYKVNPLYKFSLQINDIKYIFNDKKPHKDVVFLAIDEKSVNTFGRWPWDRKVLADGLEKLSDAKAVVFDMVFSEQTNLKSDEALANSISELDNTICGFFLRNNATQILNDDSKEVLLESSLERVFVENSPFIGLNYAETNIFNILNSCSLNAIFLTLSDEDGLFRRYPVGFSYDGAIYPSLGIQTLRYIYDKDIEITQNNESYNILFNQQNITIDNKGFLPLNYYKLEDYNIISFVDLYNNKIKQDDIKDKIIIIGVIEAGVSDIRATPLGQIAGPLLHYTFISNYLQDILLHIDRRIEFLFILLFGIVPLLMIKFVNNLNIRIFIYILFLFGTVILSIFLYKTYNLYVSIFYPILSFLFVLLYNGIFQFKTKDNETKFIKNAFSNYMSSNLLNEIIKHPDALKLGGERKEITILFSDIRGFTTISESIEPEELIKTLELYFTPMTNIVLNNNGTLDKYIGDAIMAFYNAPIDVQDHPKYAVKSALEMIRELKNINHKLSSINLPNLDIGIGINTDEVIIGNIGSIDRFDYSAIGDGVNLASRTEDLCKTYMVRIIITQSTKDKIGDEFFTRKLDDVKVKGKTKSITMHEVMEDIPNNHKIKELYEDAYNSYKHSDMNTAKKLLNKCYSTYDDKPSLVLLKKIS